MHIEIVDPACHTCAAGEKTLVNQTVGRLFTSNSCKVKCALQSRVWREVHGRRTVTLCAHVVKPVSARQTVDNRRRRPGETSEKGLKRFEYFSSSVSTAFGDTERFPIFPSVDMMTR